jgi:3-hydroxyacyl-[acyl-carrier-protein] dehydratase
MNTMDIVEIIKNLPHRYPFLLVDKVTDYESLKYMEALKNVTINEHFFSGHFPQRPVMPGVLILEALAQTAGLLAFESAHVDSPRPATFYFAGIDDVRFKRVVVPGDQLKLRAELLKVKREVWKFNTVATVDEQLVCSAVLLIAQRD